MHSLTDSLLIRLPKHADARGTLVVAESDVADALPFALRRVFWIVDVPIGSERGGHAHLSCHEALVCLRGSCQVTLTASEIKHNVQQDLFGNRIETSQSVLHEREFVLDDAALALHIPPKVWCRLHSFSEDCVLVCMASESYNPSGYIHDFEHFKTCCVL
ncbi:MAG: FdtA/QdtA family cupin domain-containing protein [Bacteroidaceae bacterium]|nr:FdtA/QdtA family cupin domain-containing protein [Bacteroidaceae bacterium]